MGYDNGLFDAQQNRKLIKLRKKIFEFRTEYFEMAWKSRFRDQWMNTDEAVVKNKQDKNARQRFTGAELKNSGKRVIYYIDRTKNNWLKAFKAKHEKLNVLRQVLNCTKKQEYWLPQIIEDANSISILCYPAKSPKKISNVEAEIYAEDNKFKGEISQNHEYSLIRSTGFQYRLKVSKESNSEVIPFTDWVVCICNGELKPTLNRVSGKKRKSVKKKYVDVIKKPLILRERVSTEVAPFRRKFQFIDLFKQDIQE